MADLTLRKVPEEVHRSLRRSAHEHGRSLNAEILSILGRETEQTRRRRNLSKVIAEIDKLREEVSRNYPHQPDSVGLIREDRDSR